MPLGHDGDVQQIADLKFCGVNFKLIELLYQLRLVQGGSEDQ
jgi:hypothetical protein